MFALHQRIMLPRIYQFFKRAQVKSSYAKDFFVLHPKVMTVILVGIALGFCVIFHTVTKEPPENSALARKLSTSVAELMVR